MTHYTQFPGYPNKADYTTNAASYYDDLARKNELLKYLSMRIWEYDKELAKRFADWDQNLATLPDDLRDLLELWIDDGTFAHIINDEIFQMKVDKVDLPYRTPEDYGAVGDGVADDTTAWQAMVNASRFCLIPAKTYKLTSITLPDKTFIQGTENSIIRPSSDTPVLKANGLTKLTIQDITIDGTDGDKNVGIEVLNSANISIKNVTLKEIPVTALHLNFCENFDISGCHFLNIGTSQNQNANGVNMGSAAVIQNSSYGNVHHNTFKNIWQIGVFVWADNGKCVGVGVHHNNIEEVYDNAIRFQPDPNTTTGVRDWNGVNGCHASYNTIKNVTIDGIRLSGNSNQAIGNLIEDVDGRGVTTQGGTDLNVSKNIVLNCAEGIRLQHDIAYLVRGTIEGNELRNIYGGARAIGVTGSTTPTVEGTRILQCVVSNNRIYDSGGYGIECTNISSVNVANNIIIESAKAGIYLRDVDRGLVSGNISNNNNQGGGPYSGIMTGTNVTQTIITGNSCHDNQSQRTQSQGVYLSPGGNFIMVKNNTCFGNVGNGIADGSGSPATNIIADNFTGGVIT